MKRSIIGLLVMFVLGCSSGSSHPPTTTTSDVPSRFQASEDQLRKHSALSAWVIEDTETGNKYLVVKCSSGTAVTPLIETRK